MENIDTIDWFKGIEVSSGGIFPMHIQQSSRTSGGSSLVKNLGAQIWTAEFTTVPILLEEAYDLENDLLRLDGSLGWVYLFDKRRPTPKLWNKTDALTGYDYTSIDPSNQHIVNLSVGTTAFSKGDHFSFVFGGKTYFHRITEMITSTQARVWPPMSLNSPSTSVISVDYPAAKFQIDPASVNNKIVTVDQNTKNAQVSFRGIQVLS